MYNKVLLKKYGVLFSFILIFIIFAFAFNDFTRIDNLLNILRQCSVLTIVGIGLVIVMIAGEIDLSFTSSIPLASAIFVNLYNNNSSIFIAMLLSLLVLIIVGIINAYLVEGIGLSSFIATLSVSFFLTGVNYAVFGAKSYWLKDDLMQNTFQGNFLFIPKFGWILIIISLLSYFVINYTKHGKYIRASGENPYTTVANGINAKYYRGLAFIEANLFYFVATMLQVARLSGALGPAAGGNIMLPVMAIAFLGQTFFKTGKPNIVGVVLSGLFLSMVNNALTLAEVKFYYVPMVQGLILIVAIVLSSSAGKRELTQIKFG